MADAPLHVVELARHTDTGRVRDHNEDRAYAHDELVAVADGMGGAAAGEVAAQLAIRAIRQLTGQIDTASLRTALESANSAIRRTAASDPSKQGMGTTMTAVAVDNGLAQIVHVGDSRAYLWRDGELRQLTNDHSVVGEMVRRGTLSADEAAPAPPPQRDHPRPRGGTRRRGRRDDRGPAIRRRAAAVQRRALHRGRRCRNRRRAARGARDSTMPPMPLVDRANAAGGADNVTVVLARIGYGPAASGVAPGHQRHHPGTPGGRRRRAPEQPPSPGTAIGARVLEPAGSARRRVSRTGLLVGAAVLVVLLMVGGAWWAISRSFTIQSGPGGTVWVDQGVKLGPVDLTAHWQDTGVPAATSRAGQLSQQLGSVGGEGATVHTAVEHGLGRRAARRSPSITAAPGEPPKTKTGG